MSVEFNLRDFFDPVTILRLKHLFGKSQYFTPDVMRRYQEERLRKIVDHAARHVPYYRELFARQGIRPRDIRTAADLARIPRLTSGTLRSEYGRLVADNSGRFGPSVGHTSGTSGQRLCFLLDRSTNALEFVYYWRSWGWAGYRLGDPFAEFSSSYFMKETRRGEAAAHTYLQPGTGRLLLNSLCLSPETSAVIARRILRHKARFIKGLPSVLYHFSLFLMKAGIQLRFRAVFSTGEILTPHQRRAIETAFGCKAYDSYGQMQRVAAMSECPAGGLHVHSDYGLAEFTDRRSLESRPGMPPRFLARLVATSLYNFSMPLLRYETGDLVEIEEAPAACPCGRTLPLVRRIEGREEDVVVLPDGNVAPTLFLVFDEVEGIRMGQIIQESPTSLTVKLVRAPEYTHETEKDLLMKLRRSVGEEMRISIQYAEDEKEMIQPGKKLKIVTSKVPNPYLRAVL